MEEQELRIKVGARIRDERKRAGYDRLEDFAPLIGMDTSNLSRIEQGKRGIDIVTISKIGDALDLRPDVFFADHRTDAVVHARTSEGGNDPVVKWALDLIADMRFARTQVQRHGW